MTTSVDNQYKHSPLPGQKWIRLLRLPPQAGIAPVTASLDFHELTDDIVSYTSLSYSWGRNSDGDASPNRKMLIQGQSLAITENLYDFLLRIRPNQDQDAVLLWVDAVCINQTDVPERNAQVAMMAEIYRKAAKLIIWLGNDADNKIDEAVAESFMRRSWPDQGDGRAPKAAMLKELLEDLDPRRFGISLSLIRWMAFRLGLFSLHVLARAGTYSSRLTYQWWHIRLSSLAPLIVRFALEPATRLSSYSKALAMLQPDGAERLLYLHWEAKFPDRMQQRLTSDVCDVASLCRRRYFSRRWVVQEIHSSKYNAARVHWGGYHTSLDEFVRVLERTESIAHALPRRRRDGKLKDSGQIQALKSACVACHTCCSLLQLSRGHPNDGEKMLKLLENFENTACSDDRDRLFAFLSMTGKTPIMSADYSSSTAETYVDFARRLIGNGDLVPVLEASAAQWATPREERYASAPILNLPSWVPDLRLSVKTGLGGAYRRETVSTMADAVTFPALMGVINLQAEKAPSAWSKDVKSGDYFCEAGTWTYTVFALRPVKLLEDGSPESFTLIGKRWDHTDRTYLEVARSWRQSITLY